MLVLGYGISELNEERQRMNLFCTYQDYFGFCIKRCMSFTRIRIRIQEISPEFHWKDWCWSSNTLATWCEEPTHWKRPWRWERWKAGGEGNDRGWDGWMASRTQWTWVWASSGSWWWTGKPGCSPWGHKKSDTTEWLNWTYTRIHQINFS